jgi:hypothetical protein
MRWRYLIEGPWIVFVAYWAPGALKRRRTVSRESVASRSGFLVCFPDAARLMIPTWLEHGNSK